MALRSAVYLVFLAMCCATVANAAGTVAYCPTVDDEGLIGDWKGNCYQMAAVGPTGQTACLPQGNVIGQPYYVRYFRDANGALQVKYRLTAVATTATDGSIWQLGSATSQSVSITSLASAADEGKCCLFAQHPGANIVYSLQLEKSTNVSNTDLRMTEQGVLATSTLAGTNLCPDVLIQPRCTAVYFVYRCDLIKYPSGQVPVEDPVAPPMDLPGTTVVDTSAMTSGTTTAAGTQTTATTGTAATTGTTTTGTTTTGTTTGTTDASTGTATVETVPVTTTTTGSTATGAGVATTAETATNTAATPVPAPAPETTTPVTETTGTATTATTSTTAVDAAGTTAADSTTPNTTPATR